MKIIVVGGGIGGLSTYLALKKHLIDSELKSPLGTPFSITVVESHESAARTLGGGLGLAPNGIRAIQTFAPEAVTYIQEHSFPVTYMTFRNEKGSLLGTLSAGPPTKYKYPTVAVPRPVVHEALCTLIPKEDIRWGVKVLVARELGNLVELEYADGTKETADLVIGADGVRSMVKNSLFKGQYEAKYDGLTGVGGFLKLSEIPPRLRENLNTPDMTMTFGRKGFFGYTLCLPVPADLSDPTSELPFDTHSFMWWSIYETPVIPKGKNVDFNAIKAQLLGRHGHWKSPYDEIDGPKVFQRIIELACRPGSSLENNINSGNNGKERQDDPTVQILPRYITPRLPYWSNASAPETPAENRGRIVLLGDAAHTMPPDVGQGVSCAAEDAVVYTLLLKHFLATQPPSQTDSSSILCKTAKAYEEIRKPYIHKLLDVAKRNGDAKKEMGPVGQVIRDCFMWLLCKLPVALNDYVYSYDTEAMVSKYFASKK